MARKGPGKRGTVGAPAPPKAAIHSSPKVGSPAWHASKREAFAHQAAQSRATLSAKAGRQYPGVRHGGFQCKNCGHQDWRLHRVVTNEGAHHATMAMKGCTTCGSMHPAQLHVAKTEGVEVDVEKTIDTSETALHKQDLPGGMTDLVGHRSNCPKGGSAPCGKAIEGRCGSCKAMVQDHAALGKTVDDAVLDLRKLAAEL